MNLNEFQPRALALAQKHRGRPIEFFKTLAAEHPDSPLVGMMKREFARGTKPGSKLAPIFAELNAAVPAAKAPVPSKVLADIGRQTVALATSPHDKVSKPIVAGISKALSAEAVLNQKIEACRSLPRTERIRALVRIKNEGIVAENNAKQQANHAKVQERLSEQLKSRRSK